MSQRKRKSKTCSKPLQAVASHAGAAVGLPPPGLALTQIPEALRPRSGQLRIRPTDSPYSARAERRGDLQSTVALLLTVRVGARRGATLIEVVANGSIDGWRAREALTNAAGRPLALWDGERHRTQADRLALVERALGLYGYTPPRRGGWSVSR